MFVGLVQDPRWEPPEDAPEPEPRWGWQIPWSALVTAVVFCTMLGLVPVVEGAFGPLAGYGFLCAAVAIGGWRFDRWLSRQYWRGLQDY